MSDDPVEGIFDRDDIRLEVTNPTADPPTDAAPMEDQMETADETEVPNPILSSKERLLGIRKRRASAKIQIEPGDVIMEKTPIGGRLKFSERLKAIFKEDWNRMVVVSLIGEELTYRGLWSTFPDKELEEKVLEGGPWYASPAQKRSESSRQIVGSKTSQKKLENPNRYAYPILDWEPEFARPFDGGKKRYIVTYNSKEAPPIEQASSMVVDSVNELSRPPDSPQGEEGEKGVQPDIVMPDSDDSFLRKEDQEDYGYFGMKIMLRSAFRHQLINGFISARK
ncbi:OLC1v1036291C1 [Oldenlandia corymbosa var. corymbosa]|uniref:OLC1v1036291C1 n=1 Tax=Oldenlandia corymbosa var. corymbosa TaxID=529605 RepID=A0AAV1CUZ4_OLDCO|nr:OLC1v1036291C1 [Oldenlandia corymbosa var. corymbosa]